VEQIFKDFFGQVVNYIKDTGIRAFILGTVAVLTVMYGGELMWWLLLGFMAIDLIINYVLLKNNL
jgi:hypothetical protein